MRTLLTNSGTGKIYASALAMRELGFKRVLFLVHRVTLAKQAKKSFEKVFDKKVTMGLVEARNARKEDNRGRMQPITKVTMKMQHPVREDFITVFTVKYYSINDLRYETNEDNKSSCSSYLRQYERKE